jgi:S-DNA-T family DNA segregation ATPase FtsK/SpoIIIE
VVAGTFVAVGVTLGVQTSVGEILARWQAQLEAAWEAWRLARLRRKERREKERARQRVVVKHLQRVAEEREERRRRLERLAGTEVDAPNEAASVRERLDLPLRPSTAETRAPSPRVTVRVAEPAPKPKAKSEPVEQRELPFVAELPTSSLPPISLLDTSVGQPVVDERELRTLGEAIRARCAEFGVEGEIVAATPGPVLTVFEFQPAPGVKVSQIVNLQDDLALALRAESVRIERIPGRSTLGIEVPNQQRATIRLGELLADERFRRAPSLLTLALGKTLQGEPYYADLAAMPHLLVAGATGSGKSIGLQSLITSILFRATREQVQFILIDPKRIELGVYADIPHLKTEVVVEPKKAANALRWAVAEMERRYKLLAEVHVRSIDFYNRAIRDPQTRQRLALQEGAEPVSREDLQPLPYYVIVIDELADLMMVAANEVETSIARLAQMARAVGIHLIVATQRPSVDILTGTIKANFPTRISFATASRHDSRTILDQVGAEKLLGKGDMLYLPPGSSRLIRLHGAYISEQETAALVRWLKRTGKPQLDPSVVATPVEGDATGSGEGIDDELFEEAARLVVKERQASASFLQRRLRVGFSRASRLVDLLEREGIVGPAQGAKPREVLVPADYFEEINSSRKGE